MKNALLLIILTLSSLAVEVRFEHNLTIALQKAKEQNKKVMMMYSATWCPECNYMKDVVFKTPKVSAYLQTHFILLGLDTQKDSLPKGYDYVGIPTFFFIGDDAKQTGKIVGGNKADAFLQRLKALQ